MLYTVASFPLELKLVHLKANRWRLDEPFIYVTRAGRVITVPAGFETDGGSIPRPLWWLYPPFGGSCDEAYVIHDYAYAQAEQLELSRAEADALMLEGMEVLGFRPTGRRIIYGTVRLFGALAWHTHRQRSAAAVATV